MSCNNPIQAYVPVFKNENGRRPISFKPLKKYREKIFINCQKCAGCIMEKARQWAVRCICEADMFGTDNCFITLTYEKEPKNCSLKRRDITLFLKRLRKKYSGINRVYNKKKNRYEYPIRYFASGEYGETTYRPHYHILLFNFTFDDVEPFPTRNCEETLRSDKLDDLWKLGACVIGQVDPKSAAYVSRYVAKKGGQFKGDKYREKEFIVMSRNEGIGKRWIEEYLEDTYKDDTMIIEGIKQKPPDYFDNYLREMNVERFEEIKRDRKEKILEKDGFESMSRRKDKEKILVNRISRRLRKDTVE